jgi:hypothetical protein
MTPNVLTDSITEPLEAGKGGEGGDFQITNADFVAAVFPLCPRARSRRCAQRAATPAWADGQPVAPIRWPANLSAANNNYIGCASFYPGDDGSFKARKTQFAACHFLMLDDLGTKVPLERLAGFELSWLIETSPGNHQGGIILAEPLTDGSAGRATAQRGDRLGAVRCGGDRAIESLGAAAGGDQWQTKICGRSRCTVSVSPDRMAT